MASALLDRAFDTSLQQQLQFVLAPLKLPPNRSSLENVQAVVTELLRAREAISRHEQILAELTAVPVNSLPTAPPRDLLVNAFVLLRKAQISQEETARRIEFLELEIDKRTAEIFRLKKLAKPESLQLDFDLLSKSFDDELNLESCLPNYSVR